MPRLSEYRRSTSYLRGIMVIIALILPTLSLLLLGTLWLWQNDYLLIWAVTASGVAVLIYAIERWLFAPQFAKGDHAASAREATPDPAQAAAISESERRAFASVEAIAQGIDTTKLTDRDAVLALGVETVEAVARSIHPDQQEPLWEFTVPEALALVGKVTTELNSFIVKNVPFGDQLTVGQLMAVYRWRSMIGVAEKAYDVWRILRFINPATAVAGELREKLSQEMIKGMRTEFTRRIAQAYVREVGGAAIDLYTGRLRPDLDFSSSEISSEERAPGAGAIRLLVVGQHGVGKSSTINALAGEVRAAINVVSLADGYQGHEIQSEDGQKINVIDSPGYAYQDGNLDSALQEQAAQADAILWVLSATRPDRSLDVEMLAELRAALSKNLRRPVPPIAFVLTHIDRVRPFNEWRPPYDIAEPMSEKAKSIRQAIEAVADDMKIDPSRVVPVMTGIVERAYNTEALWANVLELLPAAINMQLARALDDRGRAGIKWRAVWQQAKNAGRVLGKSVWRSNRPNQDEA